MTAKIELIMDMLLKFREDRDWKQFHTPKNLACSISIEAAELLEQFQWADKPKDLNKVKNEIADIFIYLLYLCHDLNIDLIKTTEFKIILNDCRYPVNKSKGNSNKYDEL